MSGDIERPNVLFVTVDSLRADHVSCVADSPVETPGIDAVGERGTIFTDAYAQGPFTTFSMPSLFTSRYPTGLDYVEFSDNVVGVFPDKEPTVTECLADTGYRTAGFHSNPLLSELFNFDRGFDTFDADLPLATLDLPGRLKLLTNKARRLLRQHAYLPAEHVTDRALDWLDGNQSGNNHRIPDDESPFFLWTHYMDVHGPYQRKSGITYYNKYRGERLWRKAVHKPKEITPDEHDELVAAYREEVEYTDGHIGRLVEDVRARSDRPLLVVVTADHGDGFAEHGYYSHPHEVDDELVHVPLVIDDPTGMIKRESVDEPTGLLDVAPTLVVAAGMEPPETFEGTSLSVSRNVNGPQRVIIEAEVTPGYRAAIVTNRWKYVFDEIRDSERLYDRRGGETDLIVKDTETRIRLREALHEHLDRDAAVNREEETVKGMSDEVADRLERLGYLK